MVIQRQLDKDKLINKEDNVFTAERDLKGLKDPLAILQVLKLGLKYLFCRDKNDGISHFSELCSSWPGEAKTWPKIALRVGGRAENSVLGDGRSYKSTVLRDGRPQEKSTVLRDGRVGE